MLDIIKNDIDASGCTMEDIVKKMHQQLINDGYTYSKDEYTYTKYDDGNVVKLITFSKFAELCQKEFDNVKYEHYVEAIAYNISKIHKLLDGVEILPVEDEKDDRWILAEAGDAHEIYTINGLTKHQFVACPVFNDFDLLDTMDDKDKYIIGHIVNDCYSGLALADLRCGQLKQLLRLIGSIYDLDLIKIITDARDSQRNNTNNYDQELFEEDDNDELN